MGKKGNALQEFPDLALDFRDSQHPKQRQAGAQTEAPRAFYKPV